jgi:uncharacterized protein YchJ
MAGKKDFVLKTDKSANDLTRNNHYVPQWYQKGFTTDTNELHYLDLLPDQKTLPNGKIIKFHELKFLPPSRCFFEYDLYTTFFGPFISDIIERNLFGKIDLEGSRAVRAFIEGSELERHNRFMDFFNYIDAQKTRTPKGLNWLKDQYSKLSQAHLMIEMQTVQKMHCTIWLEGVREIVSAREANIKFIVSDHPVTIYNYTCPPESPYCKYPNDPSIALKASQTIFPLDKDHCLILTNYEYASNPNLADPIAKRTNARNFAETFVRTNAFLRDRTLTDKQVQEINFVIKKRARRYIAAAQKEWLYPDKDQSINWESVKQTLLPPTNKISEFGGDMFLGFKDGSTHFQDKFGRTSRSHDFLKKDLPKKEPGSNDLCPCGRGRKYKKCCRDLTASQRPAWDVFSIRERNMIFYQGINDILGVSQGKDWDDIRRELNDEHVKEIHGLFEDLWPSDTDIISLLPKPDKRLRAVYTGIIDLRVISSYATSATLYFDEIIIQNPFINPAGYKPEYSPLEHPSQFKQQTLKNIALFFALYPFICSGAINFIPDLGVFNRHLQFQLHNIAKQRSKSDVDFSEDEKKLFEELWEEDLKRSIWGLSEEQQRKQLKEANPDASEDIINRAFEFSQKKRNNDPLALMQSDLYSNGGQVTTMNMAPGFEIALFLAQATGAIVFTDSPTRWKELVQAQHQEGLAVSTKWTELINYIRDMDFPFNIDVDTIISLWRDGKLGKMRNVWSNIYSSIFSYDLSDKNGVMKQLKMEIASACEAAHKEMSSAKPSNFSEDDFEKYTFNARLDCIIPSGGIENNNVLRLLVTCGVNNYLKSVPMAIFARSVLSSV